RDSQTASPTDSSSNTTPAAHRRTRSEPKNSTATLYCPAPGPPARARRAVDADLAGRPVIDACSLPATGCGLCCSYDRLRSGALSPGPLEPLDRAEGRAALLERVGQRYRTPPRGSRGFDYNS